MIADVSAFLVPIWLLIPIRYEPPWKLGSLVVPTWRLESSGVISKPRKSTQITLSHHFWKVCLLVSKDLKSLFCSHNWVALFHHARKVVDFKKCSVTFPRDIVGVLTVMARNSLEQEPEENPTALFQVKRKQVLVSACTCNFWKNYRDICRHQFAHTLLSIPLMPGGSCMSFICYWRDQGYFGSLPPPKAFNQILQTYCSAHFWM